MKRFEYDADEVAIAPNQATFADSKKIIQGQFEVQRQCYQILCANARADICNVSNPTSAHTNLAAEKYQRTFGNFSSFN